MLSGSICPISTNSSTSAMVKRPPSIVEANHLLLDMDDIVGIMDGYVHPTEAHVEKLIAFVTA